MSPRFYAGGIWCIAILRMSEIVAALPSCLKSATSSLLNLCMAYMRPTLNQSGKSFRYHVQALTYVFSSTWHVLNGLLTYFSQLIFPEKAVQFMAHWMPKRHKWCRHWWGQWFTAGKTSNSTAEANNAALKVAYEVNNTHTTKTQILLEHTQQ